MVDCSIDEKFRILPEDRFDRELLLHNSNLLKILLQKHNRQITHNRQSLITPNNSLNISILNLTFNQSFPRICIKLSNQIIMTSNKNNFITFIGAKDSFNTKWISFE